MSDAPAALAAELRALADRLARLPAAAPPPAPRARAFAWQAGEEDRVALLPIRHPDLWWFRKKMEGLHWTAQEVDLTRDKKDWLNRLSKDERQFIKMQLAFFATIDIDVLRNISDNFGEEVDCLEARFVYAAQQEQECVHAESYGLQIEALLEGEERDTVLNAVRTLPAVGHMRAWVLRWFDAALPLGERLVAWAAVEGVLFSASFSGIQWLREKNALPGVTQFNEFIVRDEGLHTRHTCLLVRSYLLARPSPARVHAIFRSIVEVIDAFVDASLPVRLAGMNADLMKQYVRFQADCVIADMGFVPLSNVANPFPFMTKLVLNEVAKTNFFEHTPTQYQNVTTAGAVRLALDTSPVDDD
jgi:ribonucleotide reductase beta subunit family protein with ferritin-like domain